MGKSNYPVNLLIHLLTPFLVFRHRTKRNNEPSPIKTSNDPRVCVRMICTTCGSVYFASPHRRYWRPTVTAIRPTPILPTILPCHALLVRVSGEGCPFVFFRPPPHRGVRYSLFWRTDYNGDRRRLVPLFDLTKNRPRPLKKKIPNNDDGMEGLLIYFFHLRVSIPYLHSTYPIVVASLGSRSYAPFHLPCFFKKKKTLSPSPTHTICDCTHATWNISSRFSLIISINCNKLETGFYPIKHSYVWL